MNERLDELFCRLNYNALERHLEDLSLQWLSNEKKCIVNEIRELRYIADILVNELINRPFRLVFQLISQN